MHLLVCDYCDSLGEDAQRKVLMLYTAFKRIKNFVSILVLPQQKVERTLSYLKVDRATIELEEGFSQDLSNKSHWETGDLEV
jgi:predicted transport protein